MLISDTDHFAPGAGDALWVWKAFLRGHHPILMDFGLIDGIPKAEAPDAFTPARQAMGDTRRYAERIDLIGMEPSGDGYALTRPGEEYLILRPGAGEPATRVAAGTYAVTWYDITERTTLTGDPLTMPGQVPIPPAIDGPAVLHLRRTRSLGSS